MKESLLPGTIRGQRLEKEFLKDSPWADSLNVYICFIPNAIFLPFGTDMVLGSIAKEDDELSSKYLPVEYNNPFKPSETPCITVTTLYDDPETDPTIQQISRRVGYQPQAVPQAPVLVP